MIIDIGCLITISTGGVVTTPSFVCVVTKNGSGRRGLKSVHGFVFNEAYLWIAWTKMNEINGNWKLRIFSWRWYQNHIQQYFLVVKEGAFYLHNVFLRQGCTFPTVSVSDGRLLLGSCEGHVVNLEISFPIFNSAIWRAIITVNIHHFIIDLLGTVTLQMHEALITPRVSMFSSECRLYG